MFTGIWKQPRIFWIVFSIWLLVCLIANMFIHDPDNDFSGSMILIDSYRSSGWPFIWWEGGTMQHLNRILWLGVIGNIVVALLGGVSLGLMFKSIFRNFSDT